MKYIIVLLLLLTIAAQCGPPPEPVIVCEEDMPEVHGSEIVKVKCDDTNKDTIITNDLRRVVDDEAQIVCYVHLKGIYCLPLSRTALKR